MVEIYGFALGKVQTIGYVIVNESTHRGVVVDAPEGMFEQVKTLKDSKGYKIDALLLTHGHWDHIYDAHLFGQNEIPIYGHEDEKMFFCTPFVQSVFMPEGMMLKEFTVQEWVKDGEKLYLIDKEIEVRHVPGHSPGSVMYYFGDEKMAFSGDAVFNGSIGRTDLPNADFKTLEKSIKSKIYTLPDDTILFPGHGPKTTVHKESVSNPFVKR